ncbi:MAG: hypothetical protein HC836_50540 [Richelia sp. RM2_1_2]|nr:hypothetical protein [Richelia sp. RM2_1_2]
MEVKASLLEYLLFDYTQEIAPSFVAVRLKEAFEKQDFELFKEQINQLFSKIPYQLFDTNQEKYYHSVIFIIFQLLGYHIQAEISTSKGRLDAVIITQTHVFVLEFKMNDSAKNAIHQIREKQYFQPYLNLNKPLVLVGVALKNKEVEDILVENL